MAYAGISAATLEFLQDLGEHNTKDWFATHKSRYSEHWLQAGKDFVDAVGPALQAVDPELQYSSATTGGSIYRIYRDTRFSKDKTPYKDHLDVWFWRGEGKPSKRPGLGVRITATGWAVAAGMLGFDKQGLAAFRAEAASESGTLLLGHLEELEQAGYQVSGEGYKRVPQGYDPDHPNARLLKHKGLWVMHDGVSHQALMGPGCVDAVVALAVPALPVVQWLDRVV